MEYIEKLLSTLGKLAPIATETEASYSNNSSIKAVIFDIYGTLLISSSGDIEQAEISTSNLQKALEAGNVTLIGDGDKSLEHILHDFEYTIKISHTEAKSFGIPYPEIDILKIWETVIFHARDKGLVTFDESISLINMTCTFEFLSNLVYPMPGMSEVIEALKNKGYPLGIVSNAQFYTPLVINYFLNNKIGLQEEIISFDKDLTVYSYKLRKGKPDTSLFEKLVPVLKEKYKLKPEEVLYVGNDMLKDIYTSSTLGFKTALFAGDKRSLRLRESDNRTKNLKPDFIITELKQILEIVN